jgi:hypothetical protein
MVHWHLWRSHASVRAPDAQVDVVVAVDDAKPAETAAQAPEV